MPEMIRLIIVVEGPTEANFVRRILAPHLGRFGSLQRHPLLVKPKLPIEA